MVFPYYLAGQSGIEERSSRENVCYVNGCDLDVGDFIARLMAFQSVKIWK